MMILKIAGREMEKNILQGLKLKLVICASTKMIFKQIFVIKK